MLLLNILFVYLLINVLYYAFFSISGHFPSKRRSVEMDVKTSKIAVFIPAYKEDSIIVDTAKRALLQRYPRGQYDVYVIADSLQTETLVELSELSLNVIEVSFDQSTKAKALNKAFQNIKERYDVAVILDADNVMEKDFLSKVNRAYAQGHQAIQGHRVAKNKENEMALMDGVSEEINNHLFRKGHQNVGLSSALIGSGMAFNYDLLRAYMIQIKAIGGFDKALELAFLKHHVRIHYLEEALVYDEKVTDEKTFTRQRTRWIGAQITYGLSSIGDATRQLITRGNVDYFDKSFQFLLLPRLMLLGTLLLAIPVGILSDGWTGWYWTSGAGLVYVLTLLAAMPTSLRKSAVFKATLVLPKAFILMIVAMMGFKKASKSFLHTPHQSCRS